MPLSNSTAKSWLSNGSIQNNLRLRISEPRNLGPEEPQRELTQEDVREIVHMCDDIFRTS